MSERWYVHVRTVQEVIDCPAEDLDAALNDAGDRDPTVDHMRRLGRLRGWSEVECAKRTILASSIARRDVLRSWMQQSPVIVVHE